MRMPTPAAADAALDLARLSICTRPCSTPRAPSRFTLLRVAALGLQAMAGVTRSALRRNSGHCLPSHAPSRHRWSSLGAGPGPRRMQSTVSMTLRPYQEECIAKSLSMLQQGIKRQAVSLPVGSGKTVVLANLIPRIPEPFPGATKTLVLAHRTELLDQAHDKITSINPQLRVSVEQGKSVAALDADVVVASVPTLGRANSKRLARFDPREFKCIIIDEAHHATASTYLRVLDHFKARDPDSWIMLWGCSATLRRHDGVSLGAVFDNVGYSRSLIEMWEEGWLCRARPVKVETHIDLTNVPVSMHTRDFSLSRLSAATNNAKRNLTIVKAWRELVHEKEGRQSTLIFCTDVAHMQALQKMFVGMGIDAHYVHGATSSHARSHILEQFRQQKLPVLINCGVFTEGTDIPCVDCIIMARPTRSSVLFQQMLGRGLRLFPGKENCLVIDLVDNLGKNSSLTVPSLMGLVPQFDAQGEDICTVYRDMQQEIGKNPRAIFASSMSDCANIINEHSSLQAGAVSVKLEQTNLIAVKSEQEWASLSDLPFFRGTDGFYLEFPSVGLIKVWKDGLGHFNATIYPENARATAPISLVGPPANNASDTIIPLKTDTLESAFSAVKTYIQREYPSEFQSYMMGTVARFSNEPATVKQLTLLHKLTGRMFGQQKPLMKGQASLIIDKILTSRRRKKFKTRSKKESDSAQELLHRGLRPRLDGPQDGTWGNLLEKFKS